MTLLLLLSLSVSLHHPDADFDQLRAQADQILTLKRSEARPQVDVVFQVADRLVQDGQPDAADAYYEGGLNIDPRNFDYHLKYAQVLVTQHETKKAAEQAQIIFDRCEDEATILQTQDAIGQPHFVPPPLEEMSAMDPVVVLVPLGDVDMLLLQQAQERMEKELGIKVIIRTVKFDMPEYTRYSSDGIANQQWDASVLLIKFQEAVEPYSNRNVKLLGVTNRDIYTKVSNYDVSWTSTRYGIISYHRFLANFAHEVPIRARLIHRLTIQSLFCCGQLFEMPYCEDKTCAMAYIADLDGVDGKGDGFCATCKANFQNDFLHRGQEKKLDQLFTYFLLLFPAVAMFALALYYASPIGELMLIPLGLIFISYFGMTRKMTGSRFDYILNGHVGQVCAVIGFSLYFIGGLKLFFRVRNARLKREAEEAAAAAKAIPQPA